MRLFLLFVLAVASVYYLQPEYRGGVFLIIGAGAIPVILGIAIWALFNRE